MRCPVRHSPGMGVSEWRATVTTIMTTSGHWPRVANEHQRLHFIANGALYFSPLSQGELAMKGVRHMRRFVQVAEEDTRPRYNHAT
jgi:hypothetical protein